MDYSTPSFPVFLTSQSALKLMSIESMMPSNHLTLRHPHCRQILYHLSHQGGWPCFEECPKAVFGQIYLPLRLNPLPLSWRISYLSEDVLFTEIRHDQELPPGRVETVTSIWAAAREKGEGWQVF